MSGELREVEIFTDGGCHGNPGPGAWAALLKWNGHQRELVGGELATTNNRMELQAAISALTALKTPCQVRIHTDSQYLRQGITQWIHNWKRNHWKTSTKQPVKNADLWRELDAAIKPHAIEWKWLKGHAGHAENERCDELASEEISRIRQKFSPAEQKSALDAWILSQNSNSPATLAPTLGLTVE